MKVQAYQNIKTNEIVHKDEALDYTLEKLGITIKENGDIEQEEFKQMLPDWYFSGNWIEEKVEEVEEPSVFELIKEECELEDARNQI